MNLFQRSMGFIKATSIFGFTVAGLYVFATNTRSVTIPIHATISSGATTSDGVTLFNGSDTTVSYGVKCYGPTGTQLFQRTGLTLAAKQKSVHGGNAKCANGDSAGGGFTNNMVKCGYTNPGNTNQCPTGYTMCTYNQVKQNATANTYQTGWASGVPTVSGTWSYSTDNGTTWYDYNTPDYVASAHSNATYKCASGSNGSGTVSANCTAVYQYSTQPTFCCPSAGSTVEMAAHSCTIEIDSTGGYLQSPSFKNNSPF